MLAFSRLPSSSSQCSAELSSGKQNCWSGMICCDFSSSSGLPLHRCPSAQVHPRPSQDLDLVQLFPSACRHKTHGDHNSWIYFQFHELALQQLYLISSAPGAGCPARITLLFNHIGRAAVPVALQCSWNWVIFGASCGIPGSHYPRGFSTESSDHGVTDHPVPQWATLCLCISAFPQCSLLQLELWPHRDPEDEEHCRSFQVATAARLSSDGWAVLQHLLTCPSCLLWPHTQTYFLHIYN